MKPSYPYVLKESHGTHCIYFQREDGVHVVRYLEPSNAAIREMVAHLKYIAESNDQEAVNLILIDSAVFRSPNISAIFREMRTMDRTVQRRAKGRLALIVTMTMFNGLINLLANSLMRSGDKFQIFGALEIEKAEAWLAKDR
jgi:hypothetical protein